MKTYSIILFLFIFNTSSGQTYLSPITQYFPSNQLETIDRNIKIEATQITIVTYTSKGEHLQIFKIMGVEKEKYRNIGMSTIYNCSSLDNRFITQFIVPKTEPVEFIDAIQPAQLGEELRHYRFHLDVGIHKLM
jgi:hypothetical protein